MYINIMGIEESKESSVAEPVNKCTVIENQDKPTNDVEPATVFYEDEPIEAGSTGNDVPNLGWEHDIAMNRNEMLWSYAKNNKVVMFMYIRNGYKLDSIINLRDRTMVPSPMYKHEYTSPYNHYCVCLCGDIGESLTVVGFILYRLYHKCVYLLDIVFPFSKRDWYYDYPEFREINVPMNCIWAFNKLILDIEYNCIWRKALLLDKIFKKGYHGNESRSRTVVGLQRGGVGITKTIKIIKNANLQKLKTDIAIK